MLLLLIILVSIYRLVDVSGAWGLVVMIREYTGETYTWLRGNVEEKTSEYTLYQAWVQDFLDQNGFTIAPKKITQLIQKASNGVTITPTHGQINWLDNRWSNLLPLLIGFT